MLPLNMGVSPKILLPAEILSRLVAVVYLFFYDVRIICGSHTLRLQRGIDEQLMNQSIFAEFLWGKKAKLSYLLFAAAILLLTMLGGRDIWTQEHRWADIVSGMFFRHDFLHPYLGENDYYDKPLLSYWLIALVVKLTNQLTALTLRIPSALAGVLAVWSIYRIGLRLRGKEAGFLAGWLLLTTVYFIFWARTSSADMLNLAGSLLAVSWYLDHRDRTNFLSYAVFFLIIAATSLCKGLVGAVVPALVVALDMAMRRSWKQHLNIALWLAMIPAVTVYLLPFWASSSVGSDSYGSSGLLLVYRENVLRYFQPFDHKGPLYTYFVYLPVYLLPWTLFFIPALITVRSRWAAMSLDSKWIALSVLVLFLFFTCSGSRRSYYVLPIVPFAILFITDWLQQTSRFFTPRSLSVTLLVGLFFSLAFLSFDILQPFYYSQGETHRFIAAVKRETQKIKPWSEWNVVMLDAEAKVSFYLQLSPAVKNYGIQGLRKQQTLSSLQAAWPILRNLDSNALLISRKLYAPLLKTLLVGYRCIEVVPSKYERLIKPDDSNAPVAFIPLK